MILGVITLTSASALAQEFAMSCEDLTTKLRLEATAEAKERFADLEGSCQGVVERDGKLFMTTSVVVRRVRGSNVTLYVPATDRTFTVTPDANARVNTRRSGRLRARELTRGQELNIYVAVDEFMSPIIDEVAFETETPEEIVIAPAVLTPTLPTAG